VLSLKTQAAAGRKLIIRLTCGPRLVPCQGLEADFVSPSTTIAKFAVNVSSADTSKNANKLDGCIELLLFSTHRENSPKNRESNL
jgi:hypothetical protein